MVPWESNASFVVGDVLDSVLCLDAEAAQSMANLLASAVRREN